jgi:hypothetical protein
MLGVLFADVAKKTLLCDEYFFFSHDKSSVAFYICFALSYACTDFT